MSATFHGRPEEMLLAANLHEFHDRVERACSLYRGGKLTTSECLDAIRDVTRALFRSRDLLLPEG